VDYCDRRSRSEVRLSVCLSQAGMLQNGWTHQCVVLQVEILGGTRKAISWGWNPQRLCGKCAHCTVHTMWAIKNGATFIPALTLSNVNWLKIFYCWKVNQISDKMSQFPPHLKHSDALPRDVIIWEVVEYHKQCAAALSSLKALLHKPLIFCKFQRICNRSQILN